MALNFKQVEDELTYLIDNDINNEKIYRLLHDITFNYLYNVMRPGTVYYDYETIACDVAADLFLRLRKGAKIDHFTSYISRILKLYYLADYEKNNWSVIIDTSNNYELENSIKTCCLGMRGEEFDYIENILTSIYVGQFETIINETIKESKFNFISKDRLNLELSVLLTLTKKKPTYFRLSDDLKPYVQVIITQIYDKIRHEGICDRDTCPMANVYGTLNNDGTVLDEFEF
jgi:hypothetical protein